VRKYKFKDYDYLRSALGGEGFTDNQMTFALDETYITDKGFFSFGFAHGYPILRHFYLNKEHRDEGTKNTIDLFREFESLVGKRGYTHFIGEVPKEKPRMEILFKRLGAEPYTELNGNKYYLVEVGGRRK